MRGQRMPAPLAANVPESEIIFVNQHLSAMGVRRVAGDSRAGL
jgi:hypothetical protein